MSATRKLAPVPMRRAPVKEATLVLGGDYEGWTCRVRANPRLGILDDLTGNDSSRVLPAMEHICRAWDFVDENGEPLPQPGDGGVRELTSDLIQELLQRYTDMLTAAASVPKS